jgi:hypothetical protein
MPRPTVYTLEEITEDLKGKKAYISKNRVIRKTGKRGVLRVYLGLVGTEGTLIFIPNEPNQDGKNIQKEEESEPTIVPASEIEA